VDFFPGTERKNHERKEEKGETEGLGRSGGSKKLEGKDLEEDLERFGNP